MKRKRGAKSGYKKGKKKKIMAANDSAPASIEDNQDLDGSDDIRHGIGNESPLSGVDKPSNVAYSSDIASALATAKPGLGRVKVKIKSSRTLDSTHNHSDVQTQNEASVCKVKEILGGKDLVIENKEDVYSDGPTSDLQTPTKGKSSRNSGSIKIKSSRGLNSSSTVLQDTQSNIQNTSLQSLKAREVISSDNERIMDSLASKKFAQMGMTRSPFMESQYNKEELNASLSVLKKVMKMDAAEPFNAPVDPVALGIPDYFDVIDNPMDFGTICNELEHGRKYSNSEDVFKDVEFIWANCYKYNNKGDYIIDLMKRVKKNFLKYWTAAGLFAGNSNDGASETLHSEETAKVLHEKSYAKGKLPKYKRKGIKQHKSGCLCAVCVVRRRRKERDSLLPSNQSSANNVYAPDEFKDEESSPIGNPESERTSSSLGQSPDPLSNADIEEPDQEDMEIDEHHNKGHAMIEKHVPSKSGLEILQENNNPPSRFMLVENLLQDGSSQPSKLENNSVSSMQHGEQKNYMQGEIELFDINEGRRQAESLEMLEGIKLYEDPSSQENHMMLQICKTLFSDDKKSVWNGPHSLNRRLHLSSPAENKPMHAALALLLKH